MKVAWWYESAIYDMDNVLALVRLTVQDNGTAHILTDSGKKLDFENETEASIWLTAEEYYPLDHLEEELADKGKPVDSRIRPPEASSEAELLKRMVINLNTRPEPGHPRPSPVTGVLDVPSAIPRV